MTKWMLILLGTICFMSPSSFAQKAEETPAEQAQEQKADTQEFNQDLDQFEQDMQKSHPKVASSAEPPGTHHVKATKTGAKSSAKKKPTKKKPVKKPAKKSSAKKRSSKKPAKKKKHSP